MLNVWGGDDPIALRNSINSIRRQSLRPDELVVVVDGPISRELETVLEASLMEDPIKSTIHRLPNNRGLWFGRNVGLSICRNETVALHDADDIMHPERLRLQARIFQLHELSVLGCPAWEFEPATSKIVGLRKTPVNRNLTKGDFRLTNPIHHSSVMLSRSDATAVGAYRNFSGMEDLDLWRRLARQGARIVNDTKILQALGTSTELLKRRRLTRKTFRNEIRLAQDSFKSVTGLERFQTSFNLFLRCAYRILPPSVMGLAQETFLRVRTSGYPSTLDEFVCREPLDLPVTSQNRQCRVSLP